MAGGGGGGEGEPEFQIAPMVDVLLVILIFFMTITSAQVLKVDQSIQLPLAPDAAKKDNTRSEAIVNVRWDVAKKAATFNFNDRDFSTSTELVPLLKAARIDGEKKITVGANPTYRVVIRGDRELPALHVSRAMNAAAEAGISDISFSAVNKN